MAEAIIRIPRSIVVALTGGAGLVEVALLAWAFVVVVWVVLGAAAAMWRAWRG
ncbi:hypothetical protein KKH23_10670 [Patescibacteria group bacterium]|nr:hypothetical protein [Patescibacteria group bacterium]